MLFTLLLMTPCQGEETSTDFCPVTYFEEQDALAAQTGERHEYNHERNCPVHDARSAVSGLLARAQFREIWPVLGKSDPRFDIRQAGNENRIHFVFEEKVPVRSSMW